MGTASQKFANSNIATKACQSDRGGAAEAGCSVTAASALSCLWCGCGFAARRGGSKKLFCSARHRADFHRATRQWCERDIAAGRLTVGNLRDGAAEPYTVAERDKQASLQSDTALGETTSSDPQARFIVAVSIYTIEALIRGGFLHPAERGEFAAIMTGLKHLGREPDVFRVC